MMRSKVHACLLESIKIAFLVLLLLICISEIHTSPDEKALGMTVISGCFSELILFYADFQTSDLFSVFSEV